MTTVEPEDWPVPLAIDLDDDVPSLVAIRRWVGHALNDLSDDELGDVLLVVTELVTNAFDHGRPSRRVRLRRVVAPCSIRVEVDDGTLELPVVGASRLGGHRGRGLVIVDKLSIGWGVDARPGGKTVWADIACAPPA